MIVALQVLKEAGVPASRAKYVYVVMNGEFYGLYAMIEEVDVSFLKRNDFPESASLFQSSQGKVANLRWDLADERVPSAYTKVNNLVRTLAKVHPDKGPSAAVYC